MIVPPALLNWRRWLAAAIVLGGTMALVQLSQAVSPSSWAVWPLTNPAGLEAAPAGFGAWVVPSPLPIVWVAAIALWVMVLVGSLLAAQDTPAAAQQHAFRKELRRQLASPAGPRPLIYRLGRTSERVDPLVAGLREVEPQVVEAEPRAA